MTFALDPLGKGPIRLIYYSDLDMSMCKPSKTYVIPPPVDHYAKIPSIVFDSKFEADTFAASKCAKTYSI